MSFQKANQSNFLLAKEFFAIFLSLRLCSLQKEFFIFLQKYFFWKNKRKKKKRTSSTSILIGKEKFFCSLLREIKKNLKDSFTKE